MVKEKAANKCAHCYELYTLGFTTAESPGLVIGGFYITTSRYSYGAYVR